MKWWSAQTRGSRHRARRLEDRERATEGRHVCCGMKFAALLSDGCAASSKFLLHVSDTAPSHRRRSFWGRLQRRDRRGFLVRSAYPSKSTRNVRKLQKSQQREIRVTRIIDGHQHQTSPRYPVVDRTMIGKERYCPAVRCHRLRHPG